jgi:hypothetical protein
MARSRKSPDLVTLPNIRAAVAALEEEYTAGRMADKEAARRINGCRRAVTPRDLWKASGHRAGNRRRSDWQDIRRTAFGLITLLILIVLGVWLVTWSLGLLNGGTPAPLLG